MSLPVVPVTLYAYTLVVHVSSPLKYVWERTASVPLIVRGRRIVVVAGPFVSDVRLVKTAWLCEPTTPYMESLRKSGFSVAFRPNKVVAGIAAAARIPPPRS